MSSISNEPWGQFSQSDYDDAQWQSACILDRGAGSTPKERYALPVREPDGDLNRNGVHAAAARLAGAGGGVDAPATAKRSAAKKLMSLYREIGDPPPDSISKLAGQ